MNNAIFLTKLDNEQLLEITPILQKAGFDIADLLKKKTILQNLDDISDQMWDEVHTLGLTKYLEKWFDFLQYVADQLEDNYNHIEVDGELYYWRKDK